jgi:hypothetical protein
MLKARSSQRLWRLAAGGDAARLKSRFPISYADAFAIETARRQRVALVTGKPIEFL